jgi:hypothetical protein
VSDDLLDIFLRARDLIARPENDFAWSSWNDAEDATAEIDALIAELQAGRMPDALTMQVIFAPTGPMQEVSLSSGWGNRFLGLAEEFDEALARAKAI